MNNLLDFDDYILEVNEKELQEEILNEGLKDWLKKKQHLQLLLLPVV